MQLSRLIVSLAGVLGMVVLPGCSDSTKTSSTAAAPEIRGEPIKPQAAAAPVVAAVPQESETSPVEPISTARAPITTPNFKPPEAQASQSAVTGTPSVDSPATLAGTSPAPAPGESSAISTASVPAGASKVEAASSLSKTENVERGDPISRISDSPEVIAAAVAPSVASAESGGKASGDAAAKPTSSDEFVALGFDRLAAFNFELSEELLAGKTNETVSASASAKTANDQIPESVKAYDQKRIALKGFMLPLRVEAGHVTELLMMRDQSVCCFGAVPKINEWVSVKMVGQGVKPIMDQAVTLFGTLHVGEMRENGYLVGIYRMDGERMSGPLDN